MENNLYDEILNHLQNGADAANIKELVDQAQKEITESNKKNLDEACRNYIEASRAFYKALGFSVSDEAIEKSVEITKKIVENINNIEDVIDSDTNLHEVVDTILSTIED